MCGERETRREGESRSTQFPGSDPRSDDVGVASARRVSPSCRGSRRLQSPCEVSLKPLPRANARNKRPRDSELAVPRLRSSADGGYIPSFDSLDASADTNIVRPGSLHRRLSRRRMLSPYVFRDPLRVGASCRLSSIERQRFDRGEFIVLERDGDMDIAVPPSCGPGCSALFHPATKKCQRTSQSGTRGKDRTDNSLAHPLTVGWRIRGTVDSKKP